MAASGTKARQLFAGLAARLEAAPFQTRCSPFTRFVGWVRSSHGTGGRGAVGLTRQPKM